MAWIVYFLKSDIYKRWYIGVSDNIERRLEEHNKGKSKSTKPYRPWVLKYIESFENKKEAYTREWFLKHPKGYLEKKKIVSQF
ncbi:MAG: GIY-YIG nuclease family protein [Microgenomates group bacterium]